ncbi:LacI family transcriptional regulator [Cohnella xylanilytica]|uniref:LacI family DNA-binding transcriptional regulator n=1 Tax=Cohnella xylanilytica TaxID=557555 RepID=A0A841U077_9BACL|nr:LacI family DNA-binding transcriptional regulator [Cohnella xylanilytica]MBB6692598.1 LacI family DNA-binding transcriptional regulator [Cohnella xylanilytica]GIO14834.1 LacI family transcriptional regulator [Cohnella xylanilytica]
MSKKVTMQQIADHVGVSKFAVSKALAGKSGVSAETREKIIGAATQLGYFVQKKTKTTGSKASSGPSEKSQGDTIIVLIPNVRYQNRHSFYWGRIIDGITNGLEEHRIGIMIVTEHITDNFAKLINPDGVLGLIGVGLISNQLLLEIRNLGIPFVMVDHEDPLIPSDSLFMNNYECVRRVTNYLIGNGHRKLQFVGNIRYSRSFTDRWLGYRSILEEQDIPLGQDPRLLSFEGENRSEMTEALDVILHDLQREQGLPTAFVCANDSIAICVMTVLMKMGIDIPGQVSVTGFDNIEDAAMSKPTLSTVHVNKEALGQRAVETLLWRIAHADGPKERILLSGDFVVRESTGPARE